MTESTNRPPEYRPGDPTPSLQPGGDRIASLATYFRENRDHFTSDALKRAAIDAGYEPAEIELAWSKIAWGDAERAVGRPTQPGVTIIVSVIYLVGTWVGAIGLASNTTTMNLAGPGFLAALVGGLIAWVALRGSSPSVARGIALGVVLVIALPLVFILIVLGICLATGYGPPF
jgi:hypothetical protein